MQKYLRQLEEFVARVILARVAVRLREELNQSYGKLPDELPVTKLPQLGWDG